MVEWFHYIISLVIAAIAGPDCVAVHSKRREFKTHWDCLLSSITILI